ncbi:MAG: hypothetical protein DCF15_18860 [Phormidesmis priestleyi]|uniref:Uncharacterized protein n=1 Tax=Phormidesmis priestleyi TaxID=268141 RepID=A0A2W4WSW5_9CYAN|nr:MAG: hypothetical protein DCF15_18860 [Phormidesmis priestleyi]
MNDIKIAIEGTAASEAAQALFEIEGLSGEYENDPDVRRDGGLTVIATVVAVVGGTMAIAEQIRKWYAEYKSKQGVKKLEKVLIVTRNGRFLLEDATIEEIAKALEPLAK